MRLHVVFGWLALGMLWTFPTAACDVCGCGAGGSSINLLSAYRLNTIGLRWNGVLYQAAASALHTEDAFQTAELSVRYHLLARLKINAVLPYKVNKRTNIHGQTTLHGLGDGRLTASYAVLNNTKLGKKTRLYVELGGGAKLPTGSYDEKMHDQNLPNNFNLGNGSWAYLGQGSAVLSRGNIGILASTLIQVNAAASDGYHFGNQWTTNANFYAQHELSPTFKGTVFGGYAREWLQRDTYADQTLVHGTGGEGDFGIIGANVRLRDWMLTAYYMYPFSQTYSNGEALAKGRGSVELAFIF